MADILKFPDRTAKARNKGNTLCKRGFHKWEVDKNSQFDTKAGKLVTTVRCIRCGVHKTKGQ